jgi:membrane-bound ClpP family serine protease
MATALVLIGIGLLLMLLEVFVIPGVGVAGVVGIIATIIGIVLAFNVDTILGWWILSATSVLSGILLWFSLRANTWDRFALHSEIQGKSSINMSTPELGAIGKTITRLNPIGKARFESGVFEVTAQNQLIDDHTSVRVVSLSDQKIIVEQNSNEQST